MTVQLTLGDALAQEGMNRATTASCPDAIDQLDNLIAQHAASGKPFSSNDLRKHIPEGVRPNAIGGRFQQAARRGLIRHVDWVASTKATTHGHHVKVWQGVPR